MAMPSILFPKGCAKRAVLVRLQLYETLWRMTRHRRLAKESTGKTSSTTFRTTFWRSGVLMDSAARNSRRLWFRYSDVVNIIPLKRNTDCVLCGVKQLSLARLTLPLAVASRNHLQLAFYQVYREQKSTKPFLIVNEARKQKTHAEALAVQASGMVSESLASFPLFSSSQSVLE